MRSSIRPAIKPARPERGAPGARVPVRRPTPPARTGYLSARDSSLSLSSQGQQGGPSCGTTLSHRMAPTPPPIVVRFPAMTGSDLPEVWLRGPLPDIPPLLQPVAHALLQAVEDVRRTVDPLAADHLWCRIAGPCRRAHPAACRTDHHDGEDRRVSSYDGISIIQPICDRTEAINSSISSRESRRSKRSFST